MSKPTIILATGSFSLPEFYDTIAGPIKANGYDFIVPHLRTASEAPQTGRPGAPPSMLDDANMLADHITKLADEGKEVVVMAHSYGGIPASQCTKGLTKGERSAAGKQGGIVALAYMTCLVPEIGGNAAGLLTGLPEENTMKLPMDESGWMYQTDFERAASIVCQQLPAAEGVEWLKKFPRHSAVSFGDPLTHAGYNDVPVAWLFAEEDRCVIPNLQQGSIDIIEKASGNKVDVTRLAADHCPPAAKTQETVDWICGVAKKYGS